MIALANVALEYANLTTSSNHSHSNEDLMAEGEGGSHEFPGYIRTTSMVFCIFILGIGVIGNVMVPLVILKSRDMRNSTNIFLTNLSIADLMVLLVCTPTVLVEVNSKPETWVLGSEMFESVIVRSPVIAIKFFGKEKFLFHRMVDFDKTWQRGRTQSP
ncbi:Neuropeptide Y receptor type 1 [Frankliniella fusca]|uniref:Neuropeptide Y receptor type 1 n=1 Tax=Frankliniella fusca TaxID=407009 RepID=A0AAE1HC68_9NEOP|nr:Neuropeptide Y receptor type 1 [Frankliniella fusca]